LVAVIEEPPSGEIHNEAGHDPASDITRLAQEIADHDEPSVVPERPVKLPRVLLIARSALLLIGVVSLVVAGITRNASLVRIGITNIVGGVLLLAAPTSRPRSRRSEQQRRWR
jgi:uncharacterized membrane protein HdeD (DUF308 family)